MGCIHDSFDCSFTLLLIYSASVSRSVSTITSISTTFILDRRVFGRGRRMDSLILFHSAPLALCCIMASVFTDLSGREKLFFFLLGGSAPFIVLQGSLFIS